MTGHARPLGSRYVLLMTAMLGTPVMAIAAADSRDANLQPRQQDARLADVCFVDAQHGWAVGDRGVIWHTDNGGKEWQFQTSGLTANFNSVHFIDLQTGWVAGGIEHPYTHVSNGVLLHTRDGGQTWQHDQRLMLPALKQIRFLNAAQGWAVGEAGGLFPSGVFSTNDGGRSWSPLSGTTIQGWLAGDFLDPLRGIVAGRRGSVATVAKHRLETLQVPRVDLRSLRGVKLAGPTNAWAVGDGGLVLTSADLGRNWQPPPGDVAAVASRQFDFSAVDAHGNHCWIAGSPGTRIMHSPDGGRSWQSHSTGQNLPICSLAFVDEKQGWAVGALGTILATSDGGRSWHRQRAGGTRAALLALFAEPDAVPLELLAKLSGNDGYLGVVELLARRDVETCPAGMATLPDRARTAMLAVGASDASMCWNFPLRQAGLEMSAEQLVEGWNLVNEGQGAQRLEAHLVRQIRCWRPEVVLTHAASPRGDDPLGHVIHQVVLGAVQRAADPTSFSEQITRMGLEPWQVKKVFERLADDQLGQINLTTSQLAPQLGCSLADQAEKVCGLLHDEYFAPPPTIGFRLLVNHIPQALGGTDFFSGIPLQPGGEARRSLFDGPVTGADLMRLAVQKHRNLRAILAQADEPGVDSAQLLGQISDLISQLDPSAAGQLLYQLGQHYYRSGRWKMAVETFGLLATRYPEHRLTPPAMLWLLDYWSSGETAWRMARASRTQQISFIRAASNPPAEQGPVAPLGQVHHLGEPLANSGQQLRVAEVDTTNPADRPGRALAVGEAIEQLQPMLFTDPAVQFPLAAAQRKQGLRHVSQRIYGNYANSRPRDAWWACAEGETWLETRRGSPPKSTCHVARCATPPHLDGQLDEVLWQEAAPIELHSELGDDALWPAVVMLAYDKEFLYMAIHCRKAPRVAYEAASGPRPRDPVLKGHDRVDVFLDLDRDWTTYYRFTVDHRGWTGEACWEDSTWNPDWYVAASQQQDAWTVEAAIALVNLTGDLPQSLDTWGVGMQRTVPGKGFQSWSRPACTAVMPEGFGYLIFD